MKFQQKFPVFVTAQGYDKPETLKISINGVSDDGVKYLQTKNVTLKNDRLQRIVFDLKKQQLGNYWLEAESLNGDKINYSVSLNIATKKHSVFVQTDKALYKPSDKVQFRVLVLDSQTRPFKTDKIEIFITDGAQNRIKQFEKVKLVKGIFSNEFQLSDEPVLGSWMIHVKVDGEESQKTFDVEKYVLPKFEVIIKTKPNLASTEKIIISFSAKYTYGKTIVNGTAVVHAENLQSWNVWGGLQNFSKTLDFSSGTNVVELDIKNDLNINEIYYETEVKVTVSVKDSLSGLEESASTVVTIQKKSYQIEVKSDDNNFKPNLPFKVNVFGKDLSEIPVTDLKTPVVITATFTYDTIEPELLSSTTWRPFWRPINYVQKEEKFEKNFVDGLTCVTLATTENISSISVTVRVLTGILWKIKIQNQFSGNLQRKRRILLGKLKAK